MNRYATRLDLLLILFTIVLAVNLGNVTDGSPEWWSAPKVESLLTYQNARALPQLTQARQLREAEQELAQKTVAETQVTVIFDTIRLQTLPRDERDELQRSINARALLAEDHQAALTKLATQVRDCTLAQETARTAASRDRNRDLRHRANRTAQIKAVGTSIAWLLVVTLLLGGCQLLSIQLNRRVILATSGFGTVLYVSTLLYGWAGAACLAGLSVLLVARGSSNEAVD